MESPRGAPDPKMAFIFEGNSPDKIRPRYSVFFQVVKFRHAATYRDPDSMESPCLDPFGQDWPRVVVIFPAEIPSPAQACSMEPKSGRQGGHGITMAGTEIKAWRVASPTAFSCVAFSEFTGCWV
jgi:hypothetical protein